MSENKPSLDKLIKDKTEAQLGEFFDTNDLNGYEDQMEKVELTVSPDIKRRKRLTEEENAAILQKDKDSQTEEFFDKVFE